MVSHRIAEFAEKYLWWLPLGCIVSALPAIAAIVVIGGVSWHFLRGVVP
jgi:hypothetical protein